jgi:basic membrane protein A
VALIVALTGALTLAGCGGGGDPEPGDSTAAADRPLFVYVSPDPLGVNPFLLMGQTGIEAAAERLGAEALVLESEDPMSREENLRAAVAEGGDLIVLLGFEFNDFLPSLAAEEPEVHFLVVDHCVEGAPENVHCAVFREFDGSFLIGAIAGLLSESGRVGAIGVADIPFLRRYTDGFEAGVRHIRPEAEVSIRWVGGENPFADPVRAKEQALALAADGVDQIYTAAAAGNLGVFEAASQTGFFAYGIDIDQCPAAPGRVVDNMMKRVDRVIAEAAEAILAGEAERMLVYGLGSGGLDLTALEESPPAESQCAILEHPEVIERVRELAAQIVAGEIGIEDPMGIL